MNKNNNNNNLTTEEQKIINVLKDTIDSLVKYTDYKKLNEDIEKEKPVNIIAFSKKSKVLFQYDEYPIFDRERDSILKIKEECFITGIEEKEKVIKELNELNFDDTVEFINDPFIKPHLSVVTQMIRYLLDKGYSIFNDPSIYSGRLIMVKK